ncbi:MAG: SHOCT domain-containing protein [Hydrogenophaga sp.]|uniref:SHOCT domain-containing protein n=1 Tax=Hydrogenophaga sp. TaxID=1904254 RepID=UPI001E031B06|nr:SHOCT domain-containing protein [Hydrogenophaga sp.]MBX3608802.1 SHOCT domain-containing protein [Hydrogenophaga sp.]
MFYDHGYMAGMHLGWWLVWLVIGVGVFLVLRNSGTSRDASQGPTPPDTPMDILKRRLASGDITPEEFEQRAALLRKHPV